MSDLDEIRAAYGEYTAHGRERLWDVRNPGFARLAADRDRRIVELVASSLPSAGGRVLDVGCGTGHGRVVVGEAAPDVDYVGLDLLEDRIEQSRASHPGSEFVVASADAMPFPDGSFDVALAVTLFSSLPTPALEERVAAEIARVLRPGGWLVWYDIRYDNPSNRAVHGVPGARLRALFPGWGGSLQALSLLPPIARRLGPVTAIAYPVLHAIPPLRSHLVGRLQCPR